MRNAKNELLRAIGNKKIHAATIELGGNYRLLVGYTEDELNTFLDQLDKEYDSGYGQQELLGTVWFTDGTWMERGEYDGSEWWELRERPEVPIFLTKP
ncbi:MAG: hypothetical protein EB010_11475 [Acidimicrobiia bacterium]|nr:hypothetical protein [Acidimicrobiia bacterium]